jgi:hypothetical protein
MLAERIGEIKNVTKTVFTGRTVNIFLGDSEVKINEPNYKNGNCYEFYILKAMWVMMIAEFEGSIKQLASEYLAGKSKSTRGIIVEGETIQGKGSIKNLFKKLGFTFIPSEEDMLEKLRGVNQIRHSIAHGHSEVPITAVNLNTALADILGIYQMLEKKLAL